MRVAKNNTAFRVMITSQFVNNLGSNFFNIVFLVYAATLPNKTLSRIYRNTTNTILHYCWKLC